MKYKLKNTTKQFKQIQITVQAGKDNRATRRTFGVRLMADVAYKQQVRSWDTIFFGFQQYVTGFVGDDFRWLAEASLCSVTVPLLGPLKATFVLSRVPLPYHYDRVTIGDSVYLYWIGSKKERKLIIELRLLCLLLMLGRTPYCLCDWHSIFAPYYSFWISVLDVTVRTLKKNQLPIKGYAPSLICRYKTKLVWNGYWQRKNKLYVRTNGRIIKRNILEYVALNQTTRGERKVWL